MRRFLAVMLAAMLFLCSSLTVFADDTNSNTNQPQMGGEAPDGMPHEMPEGGFSGGPGGTPPEKPNGQPGGPGRSGGARGNAPGRQQSLIKRSARLPVGGRYQRGRH